MKKVTIFVLALLCYAAASFGQTDAQKRAAANALWAKYGRNNSNPSKVPAAVPRQVANVEIKRIDPTYNALKAALAELGYGNGGMVVFKKGGTIKFPAPTAAQPLTYIEVRVAPSLPQKTIVIQANGVTFDGGNKSSLFQFLGHLRVIIQDGTFKNASLNPNYVKQAWSASNISITGETKPGKRKLKRVGGAAIEMSQWGAKTASLRVRNCQFINNDVPHYRGIGENQNGAAIRFNNFSFGEVYNCHFEGNKAVTGAALAGTSINRLTVVNTYFKGNISNGYLTGGGGFMNVKPGAPAIRVDRTILPLEVFGSTFEANESNHNGTVMQIFIGGVPDGTQRFPKGVAATIDNCYFTRNKHHGYKGAINPKKDGFMACIIFNSKVANGGRIKLTNTTFDNNFVGQSNVRFIHNFEVSNCIFANTQYLNQSVSFVPKNQRGAAFIQTGRGSFTNCTFYNNEPTLGMAASGIMSWQAGLASKVSVNNSVFVRTNKDKKIKQAITPLSGKNNIQFIPGVTITAKDFGFVSKTKPALSNPGIRASYYNRNFVFGKKVRTLRLCANSASGKGGLTRCGGARITNTNTLVTESLEDEGTKVLLFPNPSTDMLGIKGLQNNVDITIRNTRGEIVLESKSQHPSKKLNISTLKPGVYAVFVNGKIHRFIKK